MKILIVGNGAREHAIAHRIRRENPKAELVAAPGNPGIGELSVRCLLDAKLDDLATLSAMIIAQRPELVVIGPEAPLSIGLVDALREAKIPCVGPTKAAAQLESSKSFAKSVMLAAGIPTARSVLTRTPQELDAALTEFAIPVVLKADGLAAGKGVVVCKTAAELAVGREFLVKEVKTSSVLIEEFMPGVEATLMVATNGTEWLMLPTAHDYKRVGDGDSGPNTGGMGSVSPTPRLSNTQIAWCESNIVAPLLGEMRKRGAPFTGFLYVGLMIDPESGAIKVVEFNARMGDPETQSVLAMLDGSFTAGLEWIARSVQGEASAKPQWGVAAGSAVSVVAAAQGYPGATHRKGDEIDGILLALNLPGVAVYQAGTKLDARRLITSGGRVLTVTARGESIQAARRLVYRAADVVQFTGRILRRDIGGELE
jgi:phosphoribosylamine--glycine ligase